MGANRRYGDPAFREHPQIEEPNEPKTRHVWVHLARPVDLSPSPGVIIQWRRERDGWCAQVAYVPDGAGSTLIVAWIDAACLRPL